MSFSTDGFSQAQRRLSRRDFIKLGVLATGASLIPRPICAAISDPGVSERSLSFYNIYTGESLNTVYWYKGMYMPSALAEINYVLRDYRTDEIKPIDIHLLDTLYAIHMRLEAPHPFHILSGYRSPTTNNLLRKHRAGVARNSLHMRGRAADINLPGCELLSLRQVALDLRRGGVGYYPQSGFIHVDVGPVRQWE